MPGRGRKHLQLAGIGFADAWSGLEASATCWNWICRCISWVRKHLQFAGIGFVDAYPGFGSICNLLELDLQMPGRGRKHLQLAGIGFVDAWSGSEASATCWNWICRCLVGVGSICNLLELDLQMPGRGRKHLQFVGYEFSDTYPGVGSICNLLELDLQMHILGSEASAICWNWICRCISWGRKHLQLAGIGFADAWSGLEASTTCWI